MIRFIMRWHYRRTQRKISKELIARVGGSNRDVFQPIQKTMEAARPKYSFNDRPQRRPFWRIVFFTIILLACVTYFVWESIAGFKFFQQ